MAQPPWQPLLKEATQKLAQAGVMAADHDARALLAYHLGCDLNHLHRHLADPANNAAGFQTLIDQRVGRMPLAHITGTRGFWTLDLKITPEVLDPRPDTETLIEAVLKHCPNKTAPLRLLDIGTGSGAIALALLAELPNAKATATDISPNALAVAATNAAANDMAERITFIETSWAAGLDGLFDIVVSNPPYIETAVIDTLDDEVKNHEPHLALDGGADGLGAYRAILNQLKSVLRPGGLAAFEIGYDQKESVLALAQRAGLTQLQCHTDLGGQNRVITGLLEA